VTAIPGNASLGVSIFFVISGFLITHLLLRERQKTGRISLPAFTSPVLSHHAGVLHVPDLPDCPPATAACPLPPLALAGQTQPDRGRPFRHQLFAAFRSGNGLGIPGRFSVEEQFYLFWPLLLSLVGRKSGGFIAVALVVAAPLVRIASWFLVPHESIFWHRIRSCCTPASTR